MEPIIRIRDLDKQFVTSRRLFSRKKNVIHAVQKFSLDIFLGEIVGLIGESGSGKTTLSRLLLNLTPANGGSVTVHGTDLVKASRSEVRAVRSRFAVVFQDPASNLNPRQTVEHSIMRPLLINKVSKKDARARAREALSKVQMDESYLTAYPHQLSGGQQQRIAITRALVMQPDIMILDEPTSALDISVQAQVLNLLLDLQEEFGLTYLIITHDLNVIRYVSDRIAVMYMGRLIEIGKTDDVLDNPLHPYTDILINSVPILDPAHRDDEKQVFPGEPGDVPDCAEACRLALRCPHVMPQCLTSYPPMVEVTPGHFAECFLLKKTFQPNR
ncbi:MAG TPA: oligopeptide/dipeptide ABC transporter ATP-binding protein [Clostridia bacterium]|nr:oligopeptide/dipeptide ABC transporter ATP-binding protein [Clostridia bacterium]